VKKILIIAPQPFYAERGTPMNVRLICEVLGAAGNMIDLLVFPTGRPIDLPNVNIIRLPNLFCVSSIPTGPSLLKLAFDAVLAPAAFLLCLRKRYDIIHGIEEGGFLAVLYAKLLGKRSIFDMDSCISEQLRYSRFVKNNMLIQGVAALERWAFRRSSLVLTVCAALSDQARAHAPQARIAQIEDIPIIDTEARQLDLETVARLRAEHGLEGCRCVLYTGNLESYQGIDLLLASWRVFRDMPPEGGPVKLAIVGGPPEKVDFHRRAAAAIGLGDSVYWAGPRPAAEMGAWLAIADVLVSPRSEGENTPLKIYSYMAAGRPIIATRRRTHTQVLDDSMAFLAGADPGAFARAIREALADSGLAAAKAEQALATVERLYSFPVFRDKLLAAYETVSSDE